MLHAACSTHLNTAGMSEDVLMGMLVDVVGYVRGCIMVYWRFQEARTWAQGAFLDVVVVDGVHHEFIAVLDELAVLHLVYFLVLEGEFNLRKKSEGRRGGPYTGLGLAWP